MVTKSMPPEAIETDNGIIYRATPAGDRVRLQVSAASGCLLISADLSRDEARDLAVMLLQAAPVSS